MKYILTESIDVKVSHHVFVVAVRCGYVDAPKDRLRKSVFPAWAWRLYSHIRSGIDFWFRLEMIAYLTSCKRYSEQAG